MAATMSKAKLKEWKSKLKKEKKSASSREMTLASNGESRPEEGKPKPEDRQGKGGGKNDPTSEDNHPPPSASEADVGGAGSAPQGGDPSPSSSPYSSPNSSRSSSPRVAAHLEEHGGRGTQQPSRSPRGVLRKKSYSTFDMPHQNLQSASSPSDDGHSRSTPGGSSRRSKRRSAKALDATLHNNGGVVNSLNMAAVEAETNGDGAAESSDAGDESGGRTWRRWSALVANMPLPLSSVLTKSNSFLLANSSSAGETPSTPHGSESGTLRRRGATVMVMRTPEEEIKVLREHIEQLQILLQEKHNEMQHYKTQLQAAKHEISSLRSQLMNSARSQEDVGAIRQRAHTPTHDKEGELTRTDSTISERRQREHNGPQKDQATSLTKGRSLGEESLFEIGSDLYEGSEEGQAEVRSAANQAVVGSPPSEESSPLGAEPQPEEEAKSGDQKKQKERKKSMLMAMSRVDHSRFGMEVGGRSSLRAKTPKKERGGNLAQMFSPMAREEPTTATRTVALLSTAGSDFVIEEEQDCEVGTTFFASEGTNWYADHFYGSTHRNFLGIETPLGTVLVSVKREEKASEEKGADKTSKETSLAPPSTQTSYRVMLFTQDGDQRMLIPSTSIGNSEGKEAIDKLLSLVNPLLGYTGIIKEIAHPDMPEAIRRLEIKERPRKYKFGLLLVKEGQVEEEDIFSNSGGSVDWYEFLNFIGDKVRLKGWNRFAGGLDVKSDTTGEFSRFTEWRGSEIMWHVATMLPPGEGAQQIARKRHIGNDICVLVFLDGKDVSYSAKTIRSHFIHNIITIRRIPSDSLEDDASLTRYQVSVATKGDVPVFGPPLPKPAVFLKDAAFKDFLLAKMINAELAAYRTMYFSKRLRLGRRALLDALVSDFFPVDP